MTKAFQLHGNMRALVIGASGGIGNAIAEALEAYCPNGVTRLSRSSDGLDICDETSVKSAASSLPHGFDIIINATGQFLGAGHQLENEMEDWTARNFTHLFSVNAVGAALCFKHFGPLLRQDGPALFVHLSSVLGSIELNNGPEWIGYKASKAACNQITKAAALALASRNPDAITIAFHPGVVFTELTKPHVEESATIRPDQSAAGLMALIARLTPLQNGEFFDWQGQELDW